jgi:dipeptidyl aminopeptidase/acylaminoacyl peptidase
VRTYVAPAGDRLATVEQEGPTPTLYLQNADGTGRVRVHFDHVSDHVTGNYSPRQLPVTDASIRAIRRAKWSPDGRELAVIVAPALDASQVVLVSADGHALRTVSPNSQYLFGDVEWSPDSRRIAYAMSTGPYASRPDLFITDLGADHVTRVTTTGHLSGYDTFRFDATGDVLTFTEHLGWADDGINVLSRVGTADLRTGGVTYGADVVGEPQGFARDASWLLVLRTGRGRDLVKVSLLGGAESLLATGNYWQAIVLEGDREAIVMAPDANDSNGSALTFQIFGLDVPNDVRATLPTGPNVTWAALLRAH